MAPMKRSASFAKRSAKKSRTGPVPTVVNALAHAEVLPANLRSLLKHTLPIVLNANKVDRHAFEGEVVAQAEQALGAVQAALKQAHASALATQNQIIAPAEREKRTADKAAAHARLDASKAKLEENKAAKKAAEKAVEDAAEHLKSAQKEEKAADKELTQHENRVSTMTQVLAHEFVMLKEGTSAAAEGKKAVKTLLTLGKHHGFDSTLLSTFPITCKKPVASRTEFENMMFNQLQGLLEHAIEGLSQKVAPAGNAKANKVAVVAEATNSMTAAQGALQAASDALTAAQADNKDAHKAVTQADSHLRKLWEDMRHVCEAQDALTHDMKNFQEHVLQAFQEAKNKEPAPEPVPEPEPAAEAAPAETEVVA